MMGSAFADSPPSCGEDGDKLVREAIVRDFLTTITNHHKIIHVLSFEKAPFSWNCPESVNEKYTSRYKVPEITHFYKIKYRSKQNVYEAQFSLRLKDYHYEILDVEGLDDFFDEILNFLLKDYQLSTYESCEERYDFSIEFKKTVTVDKEKISYGVFWHKYD